MPLIVWGVPTLELDVGLRGTGDVAVFGRLGLFADLQREHGGLKYSWDRYTLEPLAGVAVNDAAWSFSAGAGWSVGFVQSRDSYPDEAYSSTFFDAGVVAELRARYTLGVGRGKYGLWMSLRGRAAFERKAYDEWGAMGPGSPVEAALLAGGDYSWLR